MFVMCLQKIGRLLVNRTVLVTGAASGIGKAQCEAFLAEGDYVIGVDKNFMSIQHPNFTGKIIDITEETSVKALSNLDIDILCNTAGVLDDFLPSHQTPFDIFDKVMAVNVTGTFLVTNACLTKMLEKKQGIIINMASIASLVAGGGGAAYTMSKHAIYGYTKQLNYDYAHYGIRCIALAPGAVKTPMVQADFEDDGAIAASVEKAIPMHRYAEPKEVADLTVFLASQKASYISGDIIPIDGGWIHRNIPL